MPSRSSSPSADSGSASKKRKTAAAPVEEDEAVLPAPPSPSPSFFFQDGNVLLHVKSTLFKVHRFMLQQSEVFRDALLVGTAAEGEIPRIKLEGDTEEDWNVFLRGMYDGMSFINQVPTILETRSLILLSDKYHHSFILAIATQAIEKRVKHECADLCQRRVPVNEHHPFCPYAHDTRYSCNSMELFLALFGLRDEFRLTRSIFRPLETRIALLPTDERAFFLDLNRIAPTDGHDHQLYPWHPARMSNTSLLSLLLRSHRVSELALSTFRNPPHVHTFECQALDRYTYCATVWEQLWQQVCDVWWDTQHYDKTMRRACETLGSDASKEMTSDCLSACVDHWRAKLHELKVAMDKDFDP